MIIEFEFYEMEEEYLAKIDEVKSLNGKLKLSRPNSENGNVEKLTIAPICIYEKEGYENWFKARRPKFDKESASLFIEIRVSNKGLENFKNSKNAEGVKILSDELRKYKDNVKIPKAIKNFELEEICNYLDTV